MSNVCVKEVKEPHHLQSAPCRAAPGLQRRSQPQRGRYHALGVDGALVLPHRSLPSLSPDLVY